MKLNKKLIFISFLYFAEGFPFGIIGDTLPIYLRIHGMSLASLGLISLLSLPYALKFIWAPAVDFLGSRRKWIISTQFLLSALMLVILAFNPASPDVLLWVCVASLAIMSATQDIAIDSYSIEMLKTSEMGVANGFRQAAYRVAMIVSGGVFVALGGWLGWDIAFIAASVVLAGCALVSLGLPAVEVPRSAFTVASLGAPFKDLFARRNVVQVMLFILFYKLGDMAMGPIVRPFWLERGLSTAEIGLITGTLGVVAAISGGLAGGLFMARFGIFHGLWFFGLCQCVSHLTYALVAAQPLTGHLGVYVASASESFCSGLGTAAFLAFLMSICNREYSASQYALLSALFRSAGIVAGALGGWVTEMVGYAYFFALTFFLPLPAFVFMFKVKTWILEDGSQADSFDGTDPDDVLAKPPQKPKELLIRDAPVFAHPTQNGRSAFARTRKTVESGDYGNRYTPAP
ncbi:MAG: MFS transporter [Desulfomonile tiedjei]|uniref:MFS transporter n=1 Tax=Desulfomonile tiedjei TaxID=2358 RepID=A0A9D6V269_9BACT|nr:MFS transporter [Desulfomonile tiedjei]